jgi:hypothetical protein
MSRSEVVRCAGTPLSALTIFVIFFEQNAQKVHKIVRVPAADLLAVGIPCGTQF